MILDYSYARPSAAAIKASGATGVMRYLSPTPAKNLSAAERDALLAAGLSIGLVWESTATRAADSGYLGGQVDARYAENQADALGYPMTCPIFYAVDQGIAPAAVLPYFQGVQSVHRRPVGVYGSAAVVEGVPVPWKWQTVAWSHGRISPTAHLYQRVGATPIAGTDVNDLRKPFPMWGTSLASNVTPIPTGPLPSVPGAPPAPPEDDMYGDADRARDEAVYAWLQGLQPTLATDVPAIKAQIDALNVADTRTRIGNIQYALGVLLGRAPQTVTAADIAAAIPTDIAGAVADELAKRLTKPTA